ncbi:hypothetical protein AV530_014916 [Patagioenas fasciata monilis]|uniref:Uncharacterized protein n=1 Tax=Patagioenas fasciata monilis TaxID=372326 RepID=A0A1V4K0A4_PATFA|nr:hypothetical protein AV530_014916 [Patagioenas fasciata monilis]
MFVLQPGSGGSCPAVGLCFGISFVHEEALMTLQPFSKKKPEIVALNDKEKITEEKTTSLIKGTKRNWLEKRLGRHRRHAVLGKLCRLRSALTLGAGKPGLEMGRDTAPVHESQDPRQELSLGRH